MDSIDITANLGAYLGERQPDARYSSFDYCFNYFQTQYESGEAAKIATESNLELSCLHLGFYLASWGMLRGSSDLLRRSVRAFKPVIQTIAQADLNMWRLDVDSYTPESVTTLLSFEKSIRHALQGASDTLVTKIILGVFGSVPAFDAYFKLGFGVTTFGRRSLDMIANFYRAHSDEIESARVPTLTFHTGGESPRRYTRAKVIDMIFFVEGQKRSLSKTRSLQDPGRTPGPA